MSPAWSSNDELIKHLAGLPIYPNFIHGWLPVTVLAGQIAAALQRIAGMNALIYPSVLEVSGTMTW
jgi:hypothetical protein